MANNKIGFNYYSVDTDRYIDMKIKRLKNAFGCSGIAVYDYLLCSIYREKGCFIVWDESTAFDVADYFGIKESLVYEIVNYCGVVGLFNKELLTCGSLTSKSIQERFLDWSKKAKRTVVSIPDELRIIETSTNIPAKVPKVPEKKAKDQEASHEERKEENKESTLCMREEEKFTKMLLDYNALKHEFETSDMWREQLLLNNQHYVSVEAIKAAQMQFCNILRDADQFPVKMKEAKNRFTGYLRENYKTFTQSGKEGSTDQAEKKVYRGVF